jgi:hypothetical protein
VAVFWPRLRDAGEAVGDRDGDDVGVGQPVGDEDEVSRDLPPVLLLSCCAEGSLVRDLSGRLWDLFEASYSDVLRTGSRSLSLAHCNEVPHGYMARGPNFRYGGPPPRVAFVESVAGDTGKPACVRAAAVSPRVSSASGSLGIMVAPTLERKFARLRWEPMLSVWERFGSRPLIASACPT